MSDNVRRVEWATMDVHAFTSKPKVTQTALMPIGDDGYGTGDLFELIDNAEDDVKLFEVIPGILGQDDTIELPAAEVVEPIDNDMIGVQTPLFGDFSVQLAMGA